MKFFNKQALAFAVVGALASGNALAAANISTANTVYAKEIAMPATLTVPVSWNLGYNFNDNELRYACVKLTGATPVAATVTPVIGSAVNGPMTVGSVNVNGDVAFFTLTSGDLTGPSADYTVSLSALQFTVPNQTTQITATVGLYDNPAAAGSCDATNPQLIPGTGDSEQLITFQPSYAFLTDPNTATASVENQPTAFAGFKYPVPASGTVSSAATSATLATAQLKALTYGTPATAPLTAAGVPITLADLFDTAAATNTQLMIAGNFGAWATARAFNAAVPTASSTTSTTWNVDPTALAGNFVVTVNPASANEIEAGDYAVSLKAKAKSGYTLNYINANAGASVILAPSLDETLYANDNTVDSAYSVASGGQIVQDGVRLQAPLTQVPSGWISRMVITNTGNKDRTFFLTVYGEDGNTITQGNLTGYTVKAKSTKVIDDLNTVLQGFTGAPRAAIVATVAGPEKEIKGLYQIVNTTSMSLSNYVMVNQDTGSH